MIYPKPLKKGDTIAMLAPATTVKREYVEGAAARLQSLGYNVRIMPHTLGPADGSYASSFANRLSDLMKALGDKDVRAILCARGGYGCAHLLERIPPALLRFNPKWIIGFSDISALHAMANKADVASIHAPMAKHLATLPADDRATLSLIRALGQEPALTHSWPSTPFDIAGKASGRIRGGNLAVLNGLAGTPYDILHISREEDVILFIEDIAERIYAVERMLWRLHLSGDLARLKGLVIGQFTEYTADKNFAGMEQMIAARLREWDITIPVAFNAPIGHVDNNAAIIEGAFATLETGGEMTTLQMEKL